jgi:predicted dehydrogenase
MLNFAILGAGSIARVMATTINKMNTSGSNIVRLAAVASRSLDKSKQFASEFNIEKAYGSYDELYNDPDIDLVYIATPHNFHYEQCKSCLEHSKNVLCEKPFTVNAKQAKELLELSENKKVFITEGIWTRYQPMRRIIDEEIKSGIIGQPMMVTANLSYNMTKKERLLKPELAGGALLDVGIYALNFANMILGDPDEVDSSCIKNAAGVDMSNSVTFTYKDTAKMAVLCSSALCVSDRYGMIHGSDGFIMVENINNPQSLKVFDKEYKLIKEIKAPDQLTGFEYEVEEACNAINNGEIQCKSMSHERILYMMNLMDSIRAQMGIKYPFE